MIRSTGRKLVVKNLLLLTMEEPPLKRQRVNDIVDKKDEWDPVVPSAGDEIDSKYLREKDVGITEYVDRSFEGFDCILKYRYPCVHASLV
jgi:hypothetical protein